MEDGLVTLDPNAPKADERPESIRYFGTKEVRASKDERLGTPGYRVEYQDGYISWSPADTFEMSYRTSGNLNFGHALMAMQNGETVARSVWVPGTYMTMIFIGIYKERKYILLIVDGQAPHIMEDISAGNILAEDWYILTETFPTTEVKPL